MESAQASKKFRDFERGEEKEDKARPTLEGGRTPREALSRRKFAEVRRDRRSFAKEKKKNLSSISTKRFAFLGTDPKVLQLRLMRSRENGSSI